VWQFGELVIHAINKCVILIFFHRYYADLDKAHGYYTVTLDDDPPVRLNGLNAVGQITRQMKWSKRDLFPGQHTFTLTHNDTNGRYATFDYLRYV